MNALDNVKVEAIVQDLLHIAPHAEIVHHIPGRIRLRISVSGIKAVRERDLEAIVSAVPGVLNTRINPFAKSAVIEYDHNRFPDDLWESLEELSRKPELAADVAERLQALFDRGG